MHKTIGLILGIGVFILLINLSPPENMSLVAWRTSAVAVLMVIWWTTAALPLAATALLPLLCLPLFEVAGIQDVAKPYAHPIIFLFMGGFMLAKALQQWQLHKRIALHVLLIFGENPRRMILAFMITCAFLSMWISNTATALLMLPIGLSIVDILQQKNTGDHKQFATALLLGIAYACSVGGISTLIGTPPNAFLAAFLASNYDIHIDFVEWLFIALPVVFVALPLMYLLLTRVIFKISSEKEGMQQSRELIMQQLTQLGSMRIGDKLVSGIFAMVATLWMIKPFLVTFFPGISDSGIALFGVLILFSLRLLSWESAKTIPWGILILFGGGLSLADSITSTGLASWIGSHLSLLDHLPVIVLMLIIITMIIFLTEITSNIATTAAFVPLIIALALSMDLNPLLFAIPATLAASCAFMLPVATPPNAVVFGSDCIKLSQMIRAGILLNILFIILLVLLGLILMQFGLDSYIIGIS